MIRIVMKDSKITLYIRFLFNCHSHIHIYIYIYIYIYVYEYEKIVLKNIELFNANINIA